VVAPSTVAAEGAGMGSYCIFSTDANHGEWVCYYGGTLISREEAAQSSLVHLLSDTRAQAVVDGFGAESSGYVGHLINTVEGATEDHLAFNCFLTFEPAENHFGVRFLGDHLQGEMKELLCFYGYVWSPSAERQLQVCWSSGKYPQCPEVSQWLLVEDKAHVGRFVWLKPQFICDDDVAVIIY